MSEVTEGTLLGGRLKYQQFAAGHRSGFEPVLLAAAVPAKPGQRVLEAGTGAGAALLCLAARVPGVSGVGVEIDAALAALANENFKINGFSALSCICADVTAGLGAQTFEHVMANPPWHEGAGTKSPDKKRALAHHARDGLLAAWVAALAACLKPRGTMTLILPAAAFSQAAACLRARKFGDIILYPLWPRAGEAAKQVIMAARLGAKGQDRVLRGMVLHDQAGITAGADAMLRDGAALDV